MRAGLCYACGLGCCHTLSLLLSAKQANGDSRSRVGRPLPGHVSPGEQPSAAVPLRPGRIVLRVSANERSRAARGLSACLTMEGRNDWQQPAGRKTTTPTTRSRRNHTTCPWTPALGCICAACATPASDGAGSTNTHERAPGISSVAIPPGERETRTPHGG